MISLCAMLSNADRFDDIALRGGASRRTIAPLPCVEERHAAHHSFDQVFRALDPKPFETVFCQWVRGIVTVLGRQIATDVKTL